MELSTKIGIVNISVPIMNASGSECTTEKQLSDLSLSKTGAVVSKSCTACSRGGNSHPKYYYNGHCSINSNGLENLGIDEYINISQKVKTKPFILSVSGINSYENEYILTKVERDRINCGNISSVELNLSCPNIIGKPQIGYCFDDMDKLIGMACKIYKGNLGLKLPPYFDIEHFNIAASIIKKHPQVNFITCCNSIGNGLIIDSDSEQTVIHPKDGLGGIGGNFIKPTALANVWMMSRQLPGVDVIGCGGVSNGDDMFQHILCGASAVQVGTHLVEEGVGCFDKILAEFRDIMHSKGYDNISDFKGKLKVRERRC